jgi:DNA replication protein DnaC
VGKNHLAIGLGIKAIYEGDKVIFPSMGDDVHALKTDEITRKVKARLKRIRDADFMFMVIDQQEANLFFYLINDLHDCSFIVFNLK